MTPTEARAEVFLTAFFTLPHAEQEIFLSKLMRNKRLREDLIDLAIAEKRKTEKSRPFSKFVDELKFKLA
jgi:hypothetical protein